MPNTGVYNPAMGNVMYVNPNVAPNMMYPQGNSILFFCKENWLFRKYDVCESKCTTNERSTKPPKPILCKCQLPKFNEAKSAHNNFQFFILNVDYCILIEITCTKFSLYDCLSFTSYENYASV